MDNIMNMTRRSRAAVAVAATLALGLGAAACTDTLVEPRSTVTRGQIFESPAGYTSFLAKLYAGLATTGQQGPAGNGDVAGIDEGFSQYLRNYWNLQVMTTDEAVTSWGDAGLPELVTAQWGATNQFVGGMYYRLFYQIALVNEFLRETSDAALSERGQSVESLLASGVDIEQYRAEARFLRALSYSHAVDLYGPVPIVDESFPTGGAPPEQATRAEVFEFAETELLDIMSDLAPIGSAAAGTDMYARADQGAAQMVLAKLYLNSEAYGLGQRYADALAAADAVIGSGMYELDDNYHDVFLADNHTSPEIIFAVAFDGARTQTYGGTTFIINGMIVGDMVAEDYGASKWNGHRLTQQAVAFYPGGRSGTDDRADIIEPAGLDSVVTARDAGGYGFPKFQNVTSAGVSGQHTEFADTDFPLFRLADAMLMYAEACHRSGGGACEANAELYVNQIRTRSNADGGGVDFDGMTEQQVLDFILAERGRELIWEATRRTDLIRYGLFTGDTYVWALKGGAVAGTAIPVDFNLFPIPSNEIIANPNMEQNPGY